MQQIIGNGHRFGRLSIIIVGDPEKWFPKMGSWFSASTYLKENELLITRQILKKFRGSNCIYNLT